MCIRDRRAWPRPNTTGQKDARRSVDGACGSPRSFVILLFFELVAQPCAVGPSGLAAACALRHAVLGLLVRPRSSRSPSCP
eukprot:12016355-Alexandrium_andersonii.AAC.1